MATNLAWWVIAGPVFAGMLMAAAAGVYALFQTIFGKD